MHWEYRTIAEFEAEDLEPLKVCHGSRLIAPKRLLVPPAPRLPSSPVVIRAACELAASVEDVPPLRQVLLVTPRLAEQVLAARVELGLRPIAPKGLRAVRDCQR